MSTQIFLQATVDPDSKAIVNAKSPFTGTEREKKRAEEVRCMLQVAQIARDQEYTEMDSRDLLTVLNQGQALFNNNTPAGSADPDEEWRANTKRPITRNKLVSIISHVLANLLFPKVSAQNENAKEDKESALIMQDLLEFQLEQLGYERIMKDILVATMYSPAAYFNMDFIDAMREVKVIQEDGSWKKEDVKDDLFSGFQAKVIPCAEVYPTNFFEHDLQKQIIIHKRTITYNQAKMKYGDNENFQFVVPGIQAFYLVEEDTFFEYFDDSQRNRLVDEIIYYDPFADLELPYLQGIPMSDPDQPLRRKDKKIPFIKTGFELINENFYYYKSGAEKLMGDDNLLSDTWNMFMDGTWLAMMPPTATFGSEDVDTAIMIPGVNTGFANADTKIQQLGPNPNLVAGLNAIGELERSISESSVTPQFQGASQRGTNTAFEVATLERNARQSLGMYLSQVGELVQDFGEMLLPLILQHQTVAEGMGTMSDKNKLRFSSVLVENREVDGEIKSRRIDFESELPEETQDPGEVSDFEFDLMKEEEETGTAIAKVNPKIFRELKFKVKVSVDPLAGRTDAVKKALKLEAYDRAIGNPFGNQETLLRDFVLEPVSPGESDKYIQEAAPKEEEGQSSEVVSQLTGGGGLGVGQLAGAKAEQ